MRVLGPWLDVEPQRAIEHRPHGGLVADDQDARHRLIVAAIGSSASSAGCGPSGGATPQPFT
jgi:hypothetical protein